MSGLEATGLRLRGCPSQPHRRLERVVRCPPKPASRTAPSATRRRSPCPLERQELGAASGGPAWLLQDGTARGRDGARGGFSPRSGKLVHQDPPGELQVAFFPFPSELPDTGPICPEPRGGRIPGLETSTRSEGPGLRPPPPPPPPGPPPGAAASPGDTSFCGFAPPSFPGAPRSPRSSHRRSAPARPPPTSRADQTAPMAERLRETTGPGPGLRSPARPHPPRPPSLLRFHGGQPVLSGRELPGPAPPRRWELAHFPSPRPLRLFTPGSRSTGSRCTGSRTQRARLRTAPGQGKGFPELRGGKGLRDLDP